MGWTDPRTWSAAELVTAAKMNEIRDSLRSSGGTVTAAPPGSPNNEDEWSMVADATNGVVWQFKYRSASASAYKWEFVGGPPMFSDVETGESLASTTFVDLATVGPAITVPRAGDYLVAYGFQMTGGGAGGAGYMMSLSIAGASALDADGISTLPVITSNFGATTARTAIKTGLSATNVLLAKYRSSSATSATIARRWLTVTPIRVS